MANFKDHIKVGATVGASSGLITNVLHQLDRMAKDEEVEFNWMELLAFTATGGVIGSVTGVLPDIIEPATNPYHRNIFHSLIIAFGLGFGIFEVHRGDLPEYGKNLLTAGGFGYLSHLVLDIKTPKGLPVIW